MVVRASKDKTQYSLVQYVHVNFNVDDFTVCTYKLKRVTPVCLVWPPKAVSECSGAFAGQTVDRATNLHEWLDLSIDPVLYLT